MAAESIRVLNECHDLLPLEGTSADPDSKLRKLTLDWRQWCSDQGLARPAGRFTVCNTRWGEDYPVLGTKWKAASVKVILGFLGDRLAAASDRLAEYADHDIHIVATALWALNQAIHTMDNASYLLREEEAVSMHDNIMLHLRCVQELALIAFCSNQPYWTIRPKAHYIWHQAIDLKRTKLNPRFFTACWEDESFLGKLKHIGKSCHGMTTGLRMLQRHFLSMAIRWVVPKPTMHLSKVRSYA